jgi:hypothetical protein
MAKKVSKTTTKTPLKVESSKTKFDENKFLKTILGIHQKGQTDITTADLIDFGVENPSNTIKIANVKLEKQFLMSKYTITCNDDTKDLLGNKLSEHDGLFDLLKDLWLGGKTQVTCPQLQKLHISGDGTTTIKLKNFKLSIPMISAVHIAYNISMVDSEKDVDNKYIDSAVTVERVTDCLRDYTLTLTKLKKISEVDLNKELELHLKHYFTSVKKSETSNKGLIDLSIGKGKVVGELKLARELKKNDQRDRAWGQIDRYREQFSDNFLFVVVGEADDVHEDNIKALRSKLLKSDGHFHYITAK